ncbi:hypothetical protein BV378_14105 [Nostoc sp. RF31YmG]|jgi:hypothetical protein|nr:hypothetical protein BV378_14105 [Nostoc sp. RF31YmG]
MRSVPSKTVAKAHDIAGRRGRLGALHLVAESMLIGALCGLILTCAGRSKEDRHDAAGAQLHIESAQGSESQGQGTNVGHGVNSSARAGCCA